MLLFLSTLYCLIQDDPLYLRAFQLLKIDFLFHLFLPLFLLRPLVSSCWLQLLKGQHFTWGQPGLSLEAGSAELHFTLPLKFYPGNEYVIPLFASRKGVTISNSCPLVEWAFMVQGWDILMVVVELFNYSQMHQKKQL